MWGFSASRLLATFRYFFELLAQSSVVAVNGTPACLPAVSESRLVFLDVLYQTAANVNDITQLDLLVAALPGRHYCRSISSGMEPVADIVQGGRSGRTADVFRALQRGLQAAGFFEAVVATIANDDVVENLHAEQRASINETTSQLDVVRAGTRIAARMVVRLMCRNKLCGPRRSDSYHVWCFCSLARMAGHIIG